MSANMEQGGGECYYKIVAVKVATSCTVTDVIFFFFFFFAHKNCFDSFQLQFNLTKGLF